MDESPKYLCLIAVECVAFLLTATTPNTVNRH